MKPDKHEECKVFILDPDLNSKEKLYLSPWALHTRVELKKQEPAYNTATNTELMPDCNVSWGHQEAKVDSYDYTSVSHSPNIPDSKHYARWILSTHAGCHWNNEGDEGLVQCKAEPHQNDLPLEVKIVDASFVKLWTWFCYWNIHILWYKQTTY